METLGISPPDGLGALAAPEERRNDPDPAVRTPLAAHAHGPRPDLRPAAVPDRSPPPMSEVDPLWSRHLDALIEPVGMWIRVPRRLRFGGRLVMPPSRSRWRWKTTGRRRLEGVRAALTKRNSVGPEPDAGAKSRHTAYRRGGTSQGCPHRCPLLPRIRLAAPRRVTYLPAMPSAIPHPELIETDSERRARLEEEERLLEAAERSFEAEGGIPAEEAFAWLVSLDTPNPLPMPAPRKDAAWRRMTDALVAKKTEARRT